MKNKIQFIIAAMLFLASCSKEDSPTIAKDDRDKFIGQWICTESSPSTFTFPINITKRGSADTVRIENFGGYGNHEPQAWALISGNSMSVPSQYITNTAILIHGSGIMNAAGNKISMEYSADSTAILAAAVH